MRPLVAHCHLGLGKLYRRTGKREQAQEHLTIATAMYREMDMRFWLEQAEAEIRRWVLHESAGVCQNVCGRPLRRAARHRRAAAGHSLPCRPS